MHLTGLAARIIYALIAGIVAFLIIWGIGAIIIALKVNLDDFGLLLERFAPLLGLLIGVWHFLAHPTTV